MFAAKARQAMVRNQSTVGKADSIVEAIDKWETTELEKVEAKAKLLGSIFCVDHADMKDQLLRNNNVMAGSVVNLLVNNQKEARKVRVQESERKKRIAQEEQAKRVKAQKLRVQAKLEEKFQLIPKEEIMTIYKECDGDMEATIDELLYLVALTEAKMREAEEKKRRAEMEEQLRQSQRKEKEKQEKNAKKDKLKKGEKKKKDKKERAGSVNEEEREKAVIMNFIESLSHGEATAELASIEDTADKNALAVSLAQEQFDSLTREEIEEVLAKHDFTLTEEASANLLQASENKQVQVLLLAFDKELEEWEIRDLLCDHDWDGAAATVALNAKLGEQKKKREEDAEKERAEKALEAEAAQKQKSDAAAAAAAVAQKQRESEAQVEERKLQSEKRLTIRRVKKTENLGNHFEKQMRERQETQAQQQQQSTAQQQQKFEGARQQLVKNLQGMFNPNMMMGGPPPRRPPRPTEPAPMPEVVPSEAEKVTFSLPQEEQEKPPAPTAAATPASAAADSEFVDHFLEVRKARAVGARGRRAPSRRPRGAAVKDAEPESAQDD